MIDPKAIARLLTDDPDLFVEDMQGAISAPGPSTGAGLSGSELGREADQIAGKDTAASDMLGDQLKKQQEMEKKAQQEKQKILKPQFDRINSTLGNMQTGVLQGQQTLQNGAQNFNDLDDEMTGLNTLIGNLQKQV